MAHKEKQSFQIWQCLITARLVHKEATDAFQVARHKQCYCRPVAKEASQAAQALMVHQTCSQKKQSIHWSTQSLTQTLLLYSFRALARHVHVAASCMFGKDGIAAGTQSTKCLD